MQTRRFINEDAKKITISSTTGTGLPELSKTFWSMSCFHLVTCETVSCKTTTTKLEQRVGGKVDGAAHSQTFSAECSRKQQKLRRLPDSKRASCCCIAPAPLYPKAAEILLKREEVR
jgi:hypothetical protein